MKQGSSKLSRIKLSISKQMLNQGSLTHLPRAEEKNTLSSKGKIFYP